MQLLLLLLLRSVGNVEMEHIAHNVIASSNVGLGSRDKRVQWEPGGGGHKERLGKREKKDKGVTINEGEVKGVTEKGAKRASGLGDILENIGEREWEERGKKSRYIYGRPDQPGCAKRLLVRNEKFDPRRPPKKETSGETLIKKKKKETRHPCSPRTRAPHKRQATMHLCRVLHAAATCPRQNFTKPVLVASASRAGLRLGVFVRPLLTCPPSYWVSASQLGACSCAHGQSSINTWPTVARLEASLQLRADRFFTA